MTKRKKDVIEKVFNKLFSKEKDAKLYNDIIFLLDLSELSESLNEIINNLKEVRYKVVKKNNLEEFGKLADVIPSTESFKYYCDGAIRESDNDLAFFSELNCYDLITPSSHSQFRSFTESSIRALKSAFNDNDFNLAIDYYDNIDTKYLKDITTVSSFMDNVNYIKKKRNELMEK